jgi:AraC-like DNA-binding protein
MGTAGSAPGEHDVDVLSDLLRVIRLKGALFLDADFGEPWCVNAPSGSDLAPVLSPGDSHMAICHLVVDGSCRAQLPGEAAVVLRAGDVVVLPHGDAHLIGSGARHVPIDVRSAVSLELPRLERLHYGGDGDSCRLICGWFTYERQIATPLTSTLPRMFTASIRGRTSGAWLESAIQYAVSEASSRSPGGGAMASHLAEVLFLESLRDHIERLPDSATGWLAGLRDPQVGRSIALMHERPSEQWTVTRLAQSVHVSRTVLAERFTALVGTSPMLYLKRWRLALAARLLHSTQHGLAQIAEQVGYQSEAAFCRAFKAEFGESPGAWRRMGAQSSERQLVER